MDLAVSGLRKGWARRWVSMWMLLGTLSLLGPRAASAAENSSPFVVTDTLRFEFSSDETVSTFAFRVFRPAGEISGFAASLAEVKDPANRRDAGAEKALTVGARAATVGPAGTDVELQVTGAAFPKPGEYRATVLLSAVGTDGKPVSQPQAVVFVRPNAEVNAAELTGVSASLVRWGPVPAWGSVDLPLHETSGKTALVSPQVELGLLQEKAPEGSPKKPAPGAVQASLTPAGTVKAGTGAKLHLQFSGFSHTGTFTAQTVLRSGSLGAPRTIPIEVTVTDCVVLPLLAIALGVGGGALLRRFTREERPRILNAVAIQRLRQELQELEGRVEGDEKRRALAELRAQVRAIEQQNELGGSTGITAELQKVADALLEFRKKEAEEAKSLAGSLQQRQTDLERKVRKYPAGPGEDPALVGRLRCALAETGALLEEARVDAATERFAEMTPDWEEFLRDRLGGALTGAAERLARLTGAPDAELQPVQDKIAEARGALQNDRFPDAESALGAIETGVEELERKYPPRRTRGLDAAAAVAAVAAGGPLEIRQRPGPLETGREIVFTLAADGGVLAEGDRIEWSAPGSERPRQRGGQRAVFRFPDAGTYVVQVTVTRVQPAGELVTVASASLPITVVPGAATLETAALLDRIRRGDRAVFFTALLLATITGLQYLYIGKTFGSLTDYLTAVLWGFGIDSTVRGFAAVVKALGAGEG
jgi:hypothetical protein